MIIGGIGSVLDMGGVDRGLGGIGLSFNKIVILSGLGWKLVLVFGQEFPCFRPWILQGIS